MKKLLLVLAAAFTMIACQTDLNEVNVESGLVDVTFEVGAPAARAYSDGYTATRLQYAVYEGETELEDLTVTNGEIHGSTTVSFKLVTGNTYTVIFWAAAPNAPYTVDFENKTMTVNYTGAVCNAENRDAFYKRHTFTVTGAQTETIELKRPFAQLNIGTNDYDEATEAGYTPTKSAVTVKNIFTTLDLWDGAVTNAEEVTFDYAQIAKSEAFPVTGYQYLAMNYLLVPADKEVVDIEFGYTESDAAAAKTRIVGSVPVQRNYRTNIYGQLLTSDVDINVVIVPEYEDEEYNNECGYYIEEGTTYITSANGLQYFAEQVNAGNAEWLRANVALATDIDLANATRSASNWTPIGTSHNLAGGLTFRGTFDGKGHTIKNMVCEGTDIAGLFGYLYAATIKNVTIENATINSKHYAGGIVAWVLNNTGNIQVPMIIENCHVVGSTITSTPEEVNGEWDNGDKVGGLVGYAHFGDAAYPANEGAKIANCSVENTTIKAYRDFGGLVGLASCATIENCSVKNVTLEQDLSHDYKAPDTPTTFSTTIGRDNGGNTVNGKPYLTDGVTTDEAENYHIYNAAGLKWVANVVNSTTPYTPTLFDNKTVYLTNDIDLENNEWIPIGDDRFARTAFKGVFDGQGHTVKNVKITKKTDKDDANKSAYGLFGNLGGTLKNLTVENVSISGAPKFIGALVGRYSGTLIENCHVKNSSVTCNNWTIGGVIGQWNTGVIRGCSIENSTIEGYAGVGAIAGLALETGERLIEDCAVKACTIKKNGSFGGNFDKMFGCILGALYSGNLTVNMNNCSTETTTIAGVASDLVCGYVSEGDVLKIDGAIPASSLDELNALLKSDNTVILNANIENATIKLPANLSNFTLRAANGVTLKNTTISAADGNAYHYENLTFDGITFDNSRILLTGWRNGEEVIKNLTVTNCEFTNIDDDSNTAALHINKDASEAVENLTFTNNVINGAVGGSKSGVYAQVTGNVVFENNVINNVSFRPYVIQVTTDDGIADSFSVKGNTFSGSSVGRAQGLGNNAEGTDAVKLVVSGNIFKDITGSQQICYWNFNPATTTADLSKNYYDIDIEANTSRIYYNSAASSVEDLKAMGVYPFYTELNADGTINLNSLKQAE